MMQPNFAPVTTQPFFVKPSSSISIDCVDCGYHAEFSATMVDCPICKSQWLQASYPYEQIAATLPALLAKRPFDLWRYRELLPVQEYNPGACIGEGGTPLIRAVNLGMMLGIPNIYIKDERQGPTHSFKDRQAAVNIASLKEAGITEVVLASTGNVAIAFAAFAARAGIKCWAFLTSLVPAEKMREVALYGAQVVKVTGTYDQTKKVAAEFARQRGLYLERGARSIPSVEGMKTIAFEVSEQLGRESTSTDPLGLPFKAPDWYFQAVSGGLGPLGVQKGFSELLRMGLIAKTPALAIIQVEGCAPMVRAWNNRQETAEPVLSPSTHIATLSTGDPGRTYSLLRQRMLQPLLQPLLQPQPHGDPGVFESVSDEEAFRAMHILAKLEGLSVEPAAAVAVAGVIKLVRAGKIKPSDTVVINCSGHTLPVEPAILGSDWARNVSLSTPGKDETPKEGLLAALSQVADTHNPKVLIVDDTEPARRLIRRILQAQGNFDLLEADDGRKAIEMAKSNLPDIIILDLMMPGIDGFGVLDALKADPRTAPIPVIVVTAKELTQDERRRMNGHIHTLMQKGEFLNHDLLDEIQSITR